MKIFNLFIAAISCLIIGASPQNQTKQCVKSLPDDTSFGFSVALNNKYLAVSDLGNNRVIIYTRDNSGQWVRTKEVLPPKDSVPAKVGLGFGRNLQLDGDVLVINALTHQSNSEVTNPEDFQERSLSTSFFYGRYLIRLDSETEVQAIDLPLEKKQGLVQFNLLSEGKIKQVTLPDNGERGFGEDTGFGYNFAFDSNLLLVGSPSYPKGGGAWLFDLARPESKPVKLTAPNAYIGEIVALNEQFAVVGDLFGNTVYDVPPNPPKTLIRAIDNGSTTLIDSYGKPSLSGNILAIMRFPSEDRSRSSLLEVFRLDDNAQAHLIKQEERIERAWVQNGFLVTVKRHFNPDARPINHIKVCLEPIY